MKYTSIIIASLCTIFAACTTEEDLYVPSVEIQQPVAPQLPVWSIFHEDNSASLSSNTSINVDEVCILSRSGSTLTVFYGDKSVELELADTEVVIKLEEVSNSHGNTLLIYAEYVLDNKGYTKAASLTNR